MWDNILWASTVLVLSLSGLAAGQAPSDLHSEGQPGTKERLASLVRIQEEARLRYRREKAAAKNEDEVEKALDRYCEAGGKNAEAALGLVLAEPRDPASIEALRFVLLTEQIGHRSRAPERAMEVLRRDHVREDGMGEICRQAIPFIEFPATESLIRGVLEGNPNREDRGRACYALAGHLRRLAKAKRWLEEKGPEVIKNWEAARGKEAVERLLRSDAEARDAEADALLERILAEFGDVPDFYDRKRTLGDVAAGDLFARGAVVTGKPGPEIEGRDQEGRAFRLSDYRGKVVVLTFSGNWCGPCRGMYPEERELVRSMKDEPFAFLSVNTDEDRETLRKSIASGEITWRCWWDGGVDGPITTRWGVTSFPTTYVLDSEGIIRFKPGRGEALEALVEELLKANSAARRRP